MTETCQLPLQQASSDEIHQILAHPTTVAIVGLSDKPDRDSYWVGAFLQQRGYRIIPINPSVSEILGQKAYARLEDVPGDLMADLEIVDIFRKPEAIPDIVASAIAIGAKTIWMQEGIVHNAAAETARAAGLKVVMSRCIMKELRKITPPGI